MANSEEPDQTAFKEAVRSGFELVLVFRAEIHKNYVRIAKGEDPDHAASDLGLHCLSIV